jgi:hypothetical protein
MKMKQTLAAAGSALLLLIACSKSATSENEAAPPAVTKSRPVKAATTGTTAKALPGCPDGTHAVLTYEFNDFNFHRPKYGCERGFWFCTIDGHWEVNCVTNSPFSYLKASTAYLWAKELDNGQLEMHFPAELKDREGYTAEDLAVFSVDEPWEIYKGITLKPGEYDVKEVERELVVIVDTIQ